MTPLTHRFFSINSQKIVTSLLAISVFLVTVGVYRACPILPGTDTIWSMYVSMSLVKEQNADLNEYRHLIIPDYRIDAINGKLYSSYPLGPSLVAAPFVYLLERFTLTPNGKLWSYYLLQHEPNGVVLVAEKLVASAIAALACVFMFLIARRHLNLAATLLVTLFFAFGTSVFSIASRGLWQHGPTILMLTIALYLIELAQDKPWLIALTSLPIGLSYLIRPTNAISVVLLSGFILLNYRKEFLVYLFLLLVVFGSFASYNYSIYQSVLPPYFAANKIFSSPYFGEALLGHLFSPSRGLFIWSPLFLLSGYGIFQSLRFFSLKKINLYLTGILLLHWVAISAFPAWWGGWSIGPRYFSDVLPYLTILLFPGLKLALSGNLLRFQTALIGLLIVMSCLIHFYCSVSYGPTRWNGTPEAIDFSPNRAWDWSDIQFLRGLCPNPDQPAPQCWLAPK